MIEEGETKKRSFTSRFKYGFYILCVFIIALPLWFTTAHLTLCEDASTRIWELLLAFFVIALLIERALEVLFTTTRARDAALMDDGIRELWRELSNKKPGTPEYEEAASKYKKALRERKQYRFDTLSLSLWCGLLLGLVISAVGFRTLESIVDESSFKAMGAGQKYLFHIVDVLLTGGLLAGGSDGIHKLAERYRGLMELPKKEEQEPVEPPKKS